MEGYATLNSKNVAIWLATAVTTVLAMPTITPLITISAHPDLKGCSLNMMCGVSTSGFCERVIIIIDVYSDS